VASIAWRKQPESLRAKEDKRLLGLIKASWLESGSVYGYRKITDDLKDLGEVCGKNRVLRLMQQEKIKAQVGYKKHRVHKSGPPATVAPNHLQRQFDLAKPDLVWVTDITYIRTHEGWLYVAIVLDLFSRQIIGWSMQSRMECDLVMKALLMALWRRRPSQEVMIYSNQAVNIPVVIGKAFYKITIWFAV
jgi:putative transposase